MNGAYSAHQLKGPNGTQTMATLATTPTAVGHLNLSLHRHTPRHHPSPGPATSRTRHQIAGTPQSVAPPDGRLRINTSSSAHSICDSPTNQTPIVRPPFSPSTSTPNYILLNKLRIQHSRLRKAPTALSTSSTPLTSTPVAKVNLSSLQQQARRPHSHVQSSKISPTRVSVNGTAPIVHSHANHSAPPLLTNKSISTRPIVTRVTAQDWLNTNRKDLPQRSSRSSIVANLSSISSSPCTSLPQNDRACVSSSFINSKNTFTSKTPSGKSLSDREVVTTRVATNGSRTAKQSAKSIGKSNSSSYKESVDRHGKLRASSSSSLADSVHNNEPDSKVQSQQPTRAAPKRAESGGQLRLLQSNDANIDPLSAGSPSVGPLNSPITSKLVVVSSQRGNESNTNCDTNDNHGGDHTQEPCDDVVIIEAATLRVEDRDRTNQSSTNGGNQKSASANSLLNFIEHASPELIFLLSESAKLSYHLAQFEQKLDYLEQIFCTKSDIKSTIPPDQASSWQNVIERTRKWISGVRLKNVFLQRKPTLLEKRPIQQQQQRVLSKSVDVADISLPAYSPSTDEYAEGTNLSSEDELIMLLDRIAQFSSNIVSKIGNQTETKANNGEVIDKTVIDLDSIVLSEKLNSLTNSNTCNNAESITKSINNRREWMQSLSGNIRELLDHLFSNKKLTSSPTGADHNFEHIFELNPELLKALVDNVKTNARLVQLQREFDRLMCAHLKSIGHSLDSKKDAKLTLTSTVAETDFFADVPPSGKQSHSLSDRTKVSNQPGHRWKSFGGTSQNVKQSKELDSHSHELSIDHLGTKSTNCCCINGLVSDGDSGGEFTATTVTNEFNAACTTEDELSSLLNQIALCSQKIIEQTAPSAPNSSTNSTASSGCCSSGVCSIGHHFCGGVSGGQPARSFQKDSHLEPTDGAEHYSSSRVRGPSWPTSVAPDSKNNSAKSSACFNCQPNGTKHLSFMKTQQHTNHNEHSSHKKQQQQHYSPYHNAQQQQHSHHPPRWHMAQSFDDDLLLHAAHVDPIYDYEPKQKFSPKRHHPTASGLHALDDSFLNMTGFMLSASTLDLLSSTSGHHQLHPQYLPQQQYHRSQQYRPEQPHHPAAYPLNMNDSTSAFIFDPNVDVESFLNEVEKELDDNCYASAPPFLQAPTHGAPLAPNTMVHHLMGNGQYHHYPKNIPNSHQHGAAPLVNNVTAPNGPNGYQMYSSLNYADINQANSSLLAGDNWRLSQRSMHDPHHRQPQQQQQFPQKAAAAVPSFNPSGNPANHHYFPFPSTASMPLGGAAAVCSSTNDSQRYKRVILPSSARVDLLDKFRAKISYRVNEEAEYQLREIDQWLHEHLQQQQPPEVQKSPARRQHDSMIELRRPSHPIDHHESDHAKLIHFDELTANHS